MSNPTTTIRLPTELRLQLKRHAKTQHKTNTEIIVQALRDFFQRDDNSRGRKELRRELERLAEIDRNDPEQSEYYGVPGSDPFREDS